MSEGLNRVTLIGNLGQDPEVRSTQGGQPVLNMRLATSERFKDKSGEFRESTEWHSVVMFGARAQKLGSFLGKGSRICVEGRIQTRSWEGKDGSKRHATEIVANNIVLLGGGPSGQRDAFDQPQRANDFDDDDIPF